MRYDVDEVERRRKKVGEAVLMVGIWGTGQRWADPDSVARCFVRLPCVCGTFATSNEAATSRCGAYGGATEEPSDD